MATSTHNAGSWEQYIGEDELSTLFPHQREGITFVWNNLVERNVGSVLAHAMGLGKTRQVLTVMKSYIASKAPDRTLCCVVVPPSLAGNWQAEAQKWVPEVPVFVVTSDLTAAKRLKLLRDWEARGGITVVTYPRLVKYASSVDEGGEVTTARRVFFEETGLVALDEAQCVKNATLVSQTCRLFQTPLRVACTGTPLMNRVEELVALVDYAQPKRWNTGTLHQFAHPIVASASNAASAYDIAAADTRAAILVKKLQDVLHRRDQKVLSASLPELKQYVLKLRTSPLQVLMYTRFADNFCKRGKRTAGIFEFRGVANRILMHPCLIAPFVEARIQQFNQKRLQWEAENASDAAPVNDQSLERDEAIPQIYATSPPINALPIRNNCVLLDSEAVPEPKAENHTAESQPVIGSDDETSAVEDHFSWLPEGSEFMTSEKWSWLRSVPSQDTVERWLQCSSKLQVTARIVQEAAIKGEKVLIFSTYIEVLRLAQDFLLRTSSCNGAELLTGDLSVASRQRVLSRMEEGEIDVLLLTHGVGGVGLTITAASRVILLEPCWNAAEAQQAVFRTYRYGQTKPVFAYQLTSDGTLEDKLLMLMLKKDWIHRRVVDDDTLIRDFIDSHDPDGYYSYKPTVGRGITDRHKAEDEILKELSALTVPNPHPKSKPKTATSLLRRRMQRERARRSQLSGSRERMIPIKPATAHTEHAPLVVSCLEYSTLLAYDDVELDQAAASVRESDYNIFAQMVHTVDELKENHAELLFVKDEEASEASFNTAISEAPARAACTSYATSESSQTSGTMHSAASSPVPVTKRVKNDGELTASPQAAKRKMPASRAASSAASSAVSNPAKLRKTHAPASRRPAPVIRSNLRQRLAERLSQVPETWALQALLAEGAPTTGAECSEAIAKRAESEGVQRLLQSLDTQLLPQVHDSFSRLPSYSAWLRDVDKNGPAPLRRWAHKDVTSQDTLASAVGESLAVPVDELRQSFVADIDLWEAIPRRVTFVVSFVLGFASIYPQIFYWGIEQLCLRVVTSNAVVGSSVLRRLARGIGADDAANRVDVNVLRQMLLSALFEDLT
ncbi:Transcriptional regulator ATRX-like protein [Diplonema papillatum]|nr:Transcriptional regulator ATRX-like protein [Diplonema papillatum]